MVLESKTTTSLTINPSTSLVEGGGGTIHFIMELEGSNKKTWRDSCMNDDQNETLLH